MLRLLSQFIKGMHVYFPASLSQALSVVYLLSIVTRVVNPSPIFFYRVLLRDATFADMQGMVTLCSCFALLEGKIKSVFFCAAIKIVKNREEC